MYPSHAPIVHVTHPSQRTTSATSSAMPCGLVAEVRRPLTCPSSLPSLPVAPIACLLTDTVATTMCGSQPELARLSASRLKEFVETPDPNLKSLGLLALSALQASDKTIVLPCRDAVLKCLDDEASVCAAALALISGMVGAASRLSIDSTSLPHFHCTLRHPCRLHSPPSFNQSCTLDDLGLQVTRASLPELVHKLIGQVRGSANVYRDDAIAVVLASCRADGFAHVPNFKWLITTLLSVAALHSKHGADVARLLLEVTKVFIAISLFR